MESEKDTKYYTSTIQTYLHEFEESKLASAIDNVESKVIVKYHKLYRLFEFLNLECINFINEHIKFKNVFILKIIELEKEIDKNFIEAKKKNKEIEILQLNDNQILFLSLKLKFDIKE